MAGQVPFLEGVQVISMSLGGLRLTADVLDTYTRTIINANRLGILAMPRRARLNLPGIPWHIIQRGQFRTYPQLFHHQDIGDSAHSDTHFPLI
jgi:hypothetical protein